MSTPKSAFDQPTPEQLTGFVSGDPIATDEVIILLLPQLYRWAIAHYPNLPEDEIRSTVHLVFAETCLHHARYAPQKSKLTTYIIRLLKFRLADLHENITEIDQELDLDFEAHEKLLQTPYNDITTVDSATRLTRDAFFQDAAFLIEAHERDFLDLMLKGEKRLEVFAEILARHGRSVNNADREVKNAKERLIRKLRTLAADLGYSLQDLLS